MNGKNVVLVVESNNKVVFEAVVGNDMVVGVGKEETENVVVLVVVGIIVVMMDAFV